MERRKFIKRLGEHTAMLSSGMALIGSSCEIKNSVSKNAVTTPMSICTWRCPKANQQAGEMLQAGKTALDAAIGGVSVEEANPQNTTVGLGGLPDREGNVTLDACVMDYKGNCGSVMAVQDIVHAAALAKEVMINTPHVALAGIGAKNFALAQGFKPKNLLTNTSKKKWLQWQKQKKYHPKINIENHDTIGMLCIDKNNNIGGACTTSGLAYKMQGRIGDSPIIGSGLFVDDEIGAAVATGMGEEVIKTVGSFLVVELMRNGLTPQKACRQAIERIINKTKEPTFQVAYLALDKHGRIGSYAIHKGFSYMVYKNGNNQNIESEYFIDKT